MKTLYMRTRLAYNLANLKPNNFQEYIDKRNAFARFRFCSLRAGVSSRYESLKNPYKSTEKTENFIQKTIERERDAVGALGFGHAFEKTRLFINFSHRPFSHVPLDET